MGVPGGIKRKYSVQGTQKGVFFQPVETPALKRLKITERTDGSESWQEDELQFNQIRGVSYEGSAGRRGLSFIFGIFLFLVGLASFLALFGYGLPLDSLVALLFFFVLGGLLVKRRRKSGYWQVISPYVVTEALGEWQIVADKKKGNPLAEFVKKQIEHSTGSGLAQRGQG